MVTQMTEPIRAAGSSTRLSMVVPCFIERRGAAGETQTLVCCSKHRSDIRNRVCQRWQQGQTLEILSQLQASDQRVRVVGLSRNFSHQVAITAGLEYASGDAIVPINADLQDPPEVIPTMVSRWLQGYEVAYL